MLDPVSRRLRAPLIAAVAVAVAVPLAAAGASSRHGREGDEHHGAAQRATILRAALAPSKPTDPTVFGVAPGGAPWVLDQGHARLSRDGVLRLRVRGLVIPTAPQNGTNPLPTLSASVVCSGKVVATTAAVPFGPLGDARIAQDVGDLPSPCIAPGVLVHPGTTTSRYIAFTGSR